LHLKGERRLYGYAEEWPSDPNTGHFRVAGAEWLRDDDIGDGRNEENSFSGTISALIPAKEVIMVEFVSMNRTQAQEIN